MQLHSIIYNSNLKLPEAYKIMHTITQHKPIWHWTLNNRLRIGFTLPNKHKNYTSIKKKISNQNITLVYEY